MGDNCLFFPSLYSRLEKKDTFREYLNNANENRDSFAEGGRKKSMRSQKQDLILHNHNNDGVDRRGFLKSMAW